MMFRTRRWPVALAALLFVAACTGTNPTTAPTTQAPAASTPPAASGTPGTSGSPSGSPAETPTGSAPTGSESPGTTGSPGAGVPDGHLVFAEWQPADQLNPYFSTAFTNLESYSPALRSLLTINEEGQWTADLATEVPSVESGALVPNADAPADCTTTDAPTGTCFTLKVTLKPGYSWSDGKPVTLNDFAKSYEKAAEWGAAGVGCSGCASFVPLLDSTIEDTAALYDVKNRYISDLTVAADGMSMDVTWQKNYAGWLGWASTAFLQSDWVSGIDAEAAQSAMPVGPGIELVPWNGPFKIVAASVDGIDYQRNDGWGGTKPQLATLHEAFFASKDGMITSFLTGEVDLAFDMTQADFDAVNAVSPDVGKAELDSAWQYEHFDLMSAGGSRLGGKVANHGLDDVEVRTAIAMAVDKQDLVDVLFPGAGVSPACSIAPPGTPWRDESVTCAPFDVAGANAKLDAAGWPVNADTGLREKDVDGDGTAEQMRFQLCTTAGNPTRLTELSKLNQYLAAVSIPSDVSTADAASVVFAGWASTTDDTNCSIYRGTYDIADYAYILGGDIYGNYYFTYHSTQIPSADNPNGSNDTRLANDDMDAALTALGYEIDPAKQNALAKTVQTTVATQNNEIPIYYRAETTGVGVRVGGWGKYNPSSAGPTWHVEDWFQAAP
jgi:peptide/nickel transport system substrate-binding protein